MKAKFGDITPTPEEKALAKMAAEKEALREKQLKAAAEQQARHTATLADLAKRRVAERLSLADIYDLQMIILEKLNR